MKSALRAAGSALLWLLGFKKKKQPKTRIGRIAQRTEPVLLVALYTYAVLVLFPNVFFWYGGSAPPLKIRSTEPIPAGAHLLGEQVRQRLARSEYYRDGDSFRVFVCNANGLYRFYAPLAKGSFAVTYTAWMGHIFVAKADLAADKAYAFRSEHSIRSFVGLAAHESAHLLLRRRLGFWRDRLLPNWLKEGYCEVISGESSFPEKEGDELICEGRRAEGMPFQYLVWRRMMEYLIAGKGLTMELILADTPPEQAVRQEMRKWLQSRQLDSGTSATAVERNKQ